MLIRRWFLTFLLPCSFFLLNCAEYTFFMRLYRYKNQPVRAFGAISDKC